MTARQLLELFGRHPALLAGLVGGPPLAALLVGLLHGKGRGGEAPWRHLYSTLVYLVVIPGMGAAVVTAYKMFFSHESLLDADLLVHFGPILSMAVTLMLVRRSVSFDELPGFDRLSGLMTVVGVTFVILLAIRKTFIGIFFGGSIFLLAAVAAFLFALLKWGAAALFRRSGDPPVKRPGFPGI